MTALDTMRIIWSGYTAGRRTEREGWSDAIVNDDELLKEWIE